MPPRNGTTAPQPSPHPGMGSKTYEGGVSFRVWAPHADEVFVAGSFNDWSTTAHPFASEGGGYWSVAVDGAKIGDEYRFVIRNGDLPLLWRKNPYASEVVNSSGNAVIHDPNFDWGDDDFTISPWNELVIYELHVGTFNEQPGPGPGTFDEIIPKLPYLRDLGVNAIEIMPVGEFPMDRSWGYNPSQPFSVECALGGPHGLYKFVKSAHHAGIAVIIDVVYNHCGPGDLDIWQFDGWTDPDHNGGIYFYDNERAQTPWGATRPDYGRDEVRQYFRDNALFWLKKYRIDGLRFDSTVNIRNRFGSPNPAGDLPDGWSLMQWINNEINHTQPWKITIAEDLQNNEWLTKDTGAGGAGFGAQWDAGFVHPVRSTIIIQDDASRNMFAVRDALQHRYNSDVFERVIYTESHDDVANGRSRVPDEIWPGNAGSWFSKKRSTLGAALVMTAPGIPMIFQGQEFLSSEYFRDDLPLDWTERRTFSGIHDLYRDLIRLRRNWHDNTRGLRGQHINVHHVNDWDKLIAFHRWADGGPGDDVIVVANFANRSYDNYKIGFPRPGMWRVRFNSDWGGYDAEFGSHLGYDTEAVPGPLDGMPCRANIGIGPYSVLILSQ